MTIFRYVQIESLCRQEKKCTIETETLFEMGRKHCVKRKKCWLPVFSKVFLLRVTKS